MSSHKKESLLNRIEVAFLCILIKKLSFYLTSVLPSFQGHFFPFEEKNEISMKTDCVVLGRLL